jgi:hypothetical protein
MANDQDGHRDFPSRAEKSGAEKSDPAGAYFSAPDVSALDSDRQGCLS